MTAFQPYQAYPAPAPVPMAPPPILVAVAPPAQQQRTTVAFRAILIVPHLFLLYFMNLAASVVLFIGWWGALFTGRLPQFAHSFLSGQLRWVSRVWAYYFLLTDVYPPFGFDDDPTYPVRVAIPEPQRLNRAAVFFRFILVFPAGFLGGIVFYGAGTLMAFVAWLMTLAGGQLPPAFYLAYAAVLRYAARLYGYYWLLTAAYPGGLFGDQPGTAAWLDTPPAGPAYGTPPPSAPRPFGAAPGYAPGPGNAAPQGYPGLQGYPGPQGSGAPQGYGAPGYGASPAYGAPGYGAPPAYGAPGYPPAPAYGGAGGYGARPAFQPVTWLLPLTAGARKLVTTFIVLGALLVPAYVGLEALAFTFGFQSAGTAETASFADLDLSGSHSGLTTALDDPSLDASECAGDPSCLSSVYTGDADAYEQFGSDLMTLDVPAGAAANEERLSVATDTIREDYATLAAASVDAESPAQSRVDQDTSTFNDAYTTLLTQLQREE